MKRRRGSTWLSLVCLNNLFPAKLRLQNQLDHFPHGSLAAGEPGDVAGSGADFGGGIGDCDAEPDVADDGEVGQVVPDIANLLWRESQLLQNFAGDRELGFKTLADDV